MGCGMGVVKYLLFIFNFIFVLCGLAILIVGVLIHVGDKNYSKDIDAINLTFPAVTLIVIGTIIFIIAFLGCCGAIRESHCMMITFACLLLTILIIQVAVAIYAFVVLKNSGDINFANEYATNVFNKYKHSEDQKKIVDLIQEEFSCCGVNGPNDFHTALNMSPPPSCCGQTSGTCSHPYDKGCAPVLEDLFKSGCAILGGVALGIAGIELLGIIFALCLANSIKNSERRGYSV